MKTFIFFISVLLFISCDDNKATSNCGDGVIDISEDCDGAVDPSRDTCQSQGYYGGILTCTDKCKFNLSQCASEGFCGDQVSQSDHEDCDGADLNDESCSTLGLPPGQLKCDSDCNFDTSSCIGDAECGNNTIEFGEDCEGINLNGHDCIELGAWQGDLQCLANCQFSDCETFEKVSMSGEHACAVSNFNKLYCWGQSGSGALGIDRQTQLLTPTEIIFPETGGYFTDVATTHWHTCALDNNKELWCWGQIYIDSAIVFDEGTPVKMEIPTGLSLHNLKSGGYHQCGLDDNGDAWCFGQGLYGQLGNGDATDVFMFTKVEMPTDVTFTDINCGEYDTCAVDTDGNGWCWGRNINGQLGNNSTDLMNIPTPVVMPTGAHFIKISAARNHTCALDITGVVFCWGSNFYGNLGTGDEEIRLIPTMIEMPLDISFIDISTYYSNSCALTSQGDAMCWGSFSDNILGQSPTPPTNANIPVNVMMPAGISFSNIFPGADFACARSEDGALYCWGHGSVGQMGNGEQTANKTPGIVSPSNE